MSRLDDRYIGLGRRASEANVIDADLFVSVHCNAFRDPQANGAEVLVYSRASRAVPIAEEILSRLVELGLRDRGVKERPKLTVLNRTKMPAVLVETAFISCKGEPDRTILRTEDGLERIAEAIVMGIVA